MSRKDIAVASENLDFMISMSFSRRQIAEIDNAAKKAGRSRASFIRHAAMIAAENMESKKHKEFDLLDSLFTPEQKEKFKQMFFE